MVGVVGAEVAVTTITASVGVLSGCCPGRFTRMVTRLVTYAPSQIRLKQPIPKIIPINSHCHALLPVRLRKFGFLDRPIPEIPVMFIKNRHWANEARRSYRPFFGSSKGSVKVGGNLFCVYERSGAQMRSRIKF